MTTGGPILEFEISNLLGSIKVRASGIKATLKKTKSSLAPSPDETESNDLAPSGSKTLDQSLNVDIKTDRTSTLNTTVVHLAGDEADLENATNVSMIAADKAEEFNQSVDINEIIFFEKEKEKEKIDANNADSKPEELVFTVE